MNFKNAIYNEFGTIDMEVEHERLGWLPFTADPNDVEPHGRDLFERTKDIALPYVPVIKTPEQLREEMPALTSRQFWMAAANIDIDKDVLLIAIKADMPDSIDRKMMIAELESSSFERTNPTVTDLMALMAIPPEQVDDLWVWAAKL